MLFENGDNFALDDFARKGSIERFVRGGRGEFVFREINAEDCTNRFSHCLGAVLLHEFEGCLLFFGIPFVVTFLARPATVSVVSAVVSIPTE